MRFYLRFLFLAVYLSLMSPALLHIGYLVLTGFTWLSLGVQVIALGFLFGVRLLSQRRNGKHGWRLIRYMIGYILVIFALIFIPGNIYIMLQSSPLLQQWYLVASYVISVFLVTLFVFKRQIKKSRFTLVRD